MTIKEIRQLTGLSAQKFGDMYKIPLRTIQDWERSARKPPVYVVKLLERAVTEDKEKGVFNMRNITANIFNTNITINIDNCIISIDEDMCRDADFDTNMKELVEDVINVQITDAGQAPLSNAEEDKIEDLIWITINAWSK